MVASGAASQVVVGDHGRVAYRVDMLKMKSTCERCQAEAAPDAPAVYICSFECTFCEPCAESMHRICPNCSGELLRRPRRTRSVADVAASQVVTRVRRLIGGS